MIQVSRKSSRKSKYQKIEKVIPAQKDLTLSNPDEPLSYLHRAEIEIKAGMYHEALEDAEMYLKESQRDENGLFVRGIARIRYGIPYLFDLGIQDLMKAAEYGHEKASAELESLGEAIAV